MQIIKTKACTIIASKMYIRDFRYIDICNNDIIFARVFGIREIANGANCSDCCVIYYWGRSEIF